MNLKNQPHKKWNEEKLGLDIQDTFMNEIFVESFRHWLQY